MDGGRDSSRELGGGACVEGVVCYLVGLLDDPLGFRIPLDGAEEGRGGAGFIGAWNCCNTQCEYNVQSFM